MSGAPDDDDPSVVAWRTAADVLGIEVEAPATLDVDGVSVGCIALIHNFGSQNGMVALPGNLGDRRLMTALTERHQAFSYLGQSYSIFDRGLFIDALIDWGWTGDGEPPGWYTGEPSTE